jgi:hypothetical protein
MTKHISKAAVEKRDRDDNNNLRFCGMLFDPKLNILHKQKRV